MKRSYDPQIQYAAPEEIARYQAGQLTRTLEYVATASPFYRRLFGEHHIDPRDIRSLEALAGLPVTTKADLQQHGADFVCVPPRQIIDYVTTSGTLGDPVTFALTDSDLSRLAYNEALSFSTAGCAPEDILQPTSKRRD